MVIEQEGVFGLAETVELRDGGDRFLGKGVLNAVGAVNGEIADVLEISIGTVESRLFRARARFKQKLLQKHPEFGQAD